MFLWFGNKTSVKTVRGGRRVVADCPGCGVTCHFHECRQEKSLSLYVVVPLVQEQQTVFRCTNCGDVFEMAADAEESAAATADHAPPRESRAQARRRRREPLAAEKRARQEQKRATERARAEEKRRKRAAVEAKRKQARKIDDELAALKRRMGLDER